MKKCGKMLNTAALGLLVVTPSLFAKVSVDQSNFDTTYDFSVDGVDSQSISVDGKVFEKLSLQGVDGYQGVFYQKGMPEIPVIRFFVNGDKDDIAIRMEAVRSRASLGKASIYPAQESQSKSSRAAVPFEMNKSFYQKNSYWPQGDYMVESVGEVKGIPQQMVTLFPVKYNPAAKTYTLRTKFNVSVEKRYDEADRAEKSPLFAFIVGNQFKNDPAIAEYKAFKQKLGYEVATIVVGVDATTPEQIRAALQSLYNDQKYDLRYAMIFGDSEHVPAKAATNLTLGVTDHFYQTMDSSYDADMNTPDISVGRVTFKTAQEVRVIVDKLIKYQKGEFANEDWLTHPSFLATDDKYTIAEGSHNYAIDTFLKQRGYTGIFPTNPQAGGDKLYAITHKVTAAQTVAAIKEGRFLIDYSGHGATTFWDAPRVRPEDVLSLNHSDALPFVVSNACITAQYIIPESFAETWMKHKNGAIAFWGSMDSSYWDEDDILERRMFNEVYPTDSKNLGTITQNSLKEVWRHYGGANRSKYYWETYHLFGDPSVELRTTKTSALNIQGSFTVPVGLPTNTYTITDANGAPVLGANVALTIGNSFRKLYRTNNLGKVEVSLAQANVGDEVTLTVYGKNNKMQSKKITIASPDYGYLTVGSLKINGSADLVSFPNESLNVTMALTNVSPVGISSGSMTLESVEGPAVILARTFTYGQIKGNTTIAVPNEMFKIKIKPEARDKDMVKLIFKWKTAENISDKFEAAIRISRAEAEISQVDFGNVALPMDGGIAPGKSGNVYLSVKNIGTQPIKGAQLQAFARECIASVQSGIALPTIAAGGVLRLTTPLQVGISSSCKNGDTANLAIKIVNSGVVSQETLETIASFSVGETGQVSFSDDNINMNIPDKQTINYRFEMSGISKISRITVGLNISHTYTGDLVVRLIAPNGTAAVLHNKAGGSNDDIIKTFGYGGEEVKDFEKFMNIPATGSWTLEITDTAASDQGKLNGLSIDLLGLKD